MAYKFQLGAFTASGSIKAEDTLDAASGFSVGGVAVTSTAAELNILDGVTATAAELNILDGVTSTAAELNILDGVTSTAAELNILDGVTSTAAELNLLDGASAANSVASKAAVLDGSRKLVGIAELSASADIIGHHGKVRQLSLAYDGAGGSEGHIKLGAGGDMQMAVFSDDAYVINNTADKDIVFQVKKAGGSNVQPLKVDGSEHSVIINKLNLSGTLVTATAAELNLIDGGASVAAGAAVADGDGLLLNDAGTMRMTTVQNLAAYFDDEITAMPNLVQAGALNAGSITSGFGSIDNGTSDITTGGKLLLDVGMSSAPSTSQAVAGQAGALTFASGSAAAIGVHDANLYIESGIDTKKIAFRTMVGSDYEEPIYIDGMGMAIADDKGIVFGNDENVSIKYDETTSDTLVFTQGVDSAALAITYAADRHDDAGDAWAMHIAASGGKKMWMNDIASKGTMVEHFSITPNATVANSTAAFAGHVTVGHDLTVAGDLTVSGDFVQMDVSKLTVEDPLIELARGQGTSADALDIGFFGRYGVGGTAKFAGLFRDQNDSGKFHLFKDTEEDLTAVTTINRSASGYAKATLVVDELEGIATKAKVTDSSANTNFDLVFHDASNGLLEDDGALTYNPSTGKLTAATFAGSLEGSIAESVHAVTANYTLDKADGTVFTLNASGGSFTVTLPAANAAGYSGVMLRLKKLGHASNTVTIGKGASGLIDGGDAVILESPYAAVMLVSDGSNWHVL